MCQNFLESMVGFILLYLNELWCFWLRGESGVVSQKNDVLVYAIS